jgi:hypothetical protein
MSKLFQFLDLETVSICNRRCPTCIRNSHPNKSKTASFFKKNLLPWNVIKEALDQCADLGFTGGVCLSHYNEPLLDDRLVQIAMLVKSYDMFSPIFLHTNGDKMHDVLAKGLDGFLDRIHISFYDDEGKEEKAKWTESLFRVTEVVNLTMSDHIPTHFSPKFDVEKLARRHQNRRCGEPQIRVIINHRREYLLCCDDVVGNFDLGTFPEISIKDFWFGNKHSVIMNDLDKEGGRLKYEYCKTCPRP